MGNDILAETKFLDRNFDHTLKCIKEMYGEEIEPSLDLCAKITDHDDETIRKTHFIILALKLYPSNLGYDSWDGMERLVPKLKELIKIESDVLINSYISLLEECIRLKHCISLCSRAGRKKRTGIIDPKNILFSDNFICIKKNENTMVLDYLGNNEELQIPDMIEGIIVDSIGDYAFYGKKLKNVVLPLGIKEIGKHAFAHCELENINLPEGLISIGEGAFKLNELTGIAFPSSVNSLGKSAFEKNKLTNVSIPANIICIPESAFKENVLTTVEIAEGVTTIEYASFYDNSLESIKIPASVKTISSSVLKSNPPLKEISLSANVELDSWGCVVGDLNEAYERNNKSAGIYRLEEKNDEYHWKLFMDKNIFTEWEINAHEEMEKLAIKQHKAIEEIKMSKEGRKLSTLQQYFRNPIPKETWEGMPEEFRESIKKVIMDPMCSVSYRPKPPENLLKEHPLFIIHNFETITVSYGPLAVRVYAAKTGAFVGMS